MASGLRGEVKEDEEEKSIRVAGTHGPPEAFRPRHACFNYRHQQIRDERKKESPLITKNTSDRSIHKILYKNTFTKKLFHTTHLNVFVSISRIVIIMGSDAENRRPAASQVN